VLYLLAQIRHKSTWIIFVLLNFCCVVVHFNAYYFFSFSKIPKNQMGDKDSQKSGSEGEEGSPYTVDAILSSSVFKILVFLSIYIAAFFAGAMLFFYIYKSWNPHLTECLAPQKPINYFNDIDTPARTIAAPVLISNAKIFANSTTTGLSDILVINGKIAAVAAAGQIPASQIPQGATSLNLGGRWVTAGLVDMHSHLGVQPVPVTGGSLDNSEAPTNPASKSHNTSVRFFKKNSLF